WAVPGVADITWTSGVAGPDAVLAARRRHDVNLSRSQPGHLHIVPVAAPSRSAATASGPESVCHRAGSMPLDGPSAGLSQPLVSRWRLQGMPAASPGSAGRSQRTLCATAHVLAWSVCHRLPAGSTCSGRPSLAELARAIAARAEPVPIPWDCVDGFYEAYWRRPEAYLDDHVRRGMSVWARAGPDAEQRAARRLRDDLRAAASPRGRACCPR